MISVRTFITPWIIGLGLTLLAPPLYANPEPGAYDARAMGLGGTGIAYLDNPAAIFHNPANLAGIETSAVTLSSALVLADLSAPLGGSDSQESTGLSPAPLALVAYGHRLNPSIVVGAGAYILTGYGGTYRSIQKIRGVDFDEYDESLTSHYDQQYPNQDVAFFVAEAVLPISFHLSPKVDLGFAFRLPYARLQADLSQEIAQGDFNFGYKRVEQVVGGFGNPGIYAGITFRPTKNIALAAVYRSTADIAMEGDTKVHFTNGDPDPFPTTSSWTIPHLVRLGGAVHLAERKLMLTAEARMQFHKSANRAMVFQIEGFGETTAPLEWNDVLSIAGGVEYEVKEKTRIRLGFSGSNSATSEAAAQFFSPPPGLLFAVYFGAGQQRKYFDVDLGMTFANASHLVGPQEVDRCSPGDQVKVGCEGRYGVTSILLNLSFTYKNKD